MDVHNVQIVLRHGWMAPLDVTFPYKCHHIVLIRQAPFWRVDCLPSRHLLMVGRIWIFEGVLGDNRCRHLP